MPEQPRRWDGAASSTQPCQRGCHRTQGAPGTLLLRKKLGKVAKCFSSKTPPEEERRLVRNAVPRAAQIHWFPTFSFIGNDPFDTFT